MFYAGVGVHAECGPGAGRVGLFDVRGPGAGSLVPSEAVFERSVGILPGEDDCVILLFTISDGFGHGFCEDVHPVESVALGFCSKLM